MVQPLARKFLTGARGATGRAGWQEHGVLAFDVVQADVCGGAGHRRIRRPERGGDEHLGACGPPAAAPWLRRCSASRARPVHQFQAVATPGMKGRPVVMHLSSQRHTAHTGAQRRPGRGMIWNCGVAGLSAATTPGSAPPAPRQWRFRASVTPRSSNARRSLTKPRLELEHADRYIGRMVARPGQLPAHLFAADYLACHIVCQHRP